MIRSISPKRQSFIAFLPFLHISLKSLISKPYDFEPNSIGEHILKRRLCLNITQAQLAKLLKVGLTSIVNWENDHTEPELRYTPSLIQFLGYDPVLLNPKSIGEQLLAKRRKYGWNQRKAAQYLGIDASTLSNWECGGAIRLHKYNKLVASFLELDDENIHKNIL